MLIVSFAQLLKVVLSVSDRGFFTPLRKLSGIVQTGMTINLGRDIKFILEYLFHAG
jgi:hypothetical protein